MVSPVVIEAVTATTGSDGRTRRTGTAKQQARAATAAQRATPTPEPAPQTGTTTPATGTLADYMRYTQYLNQVEYPDFRLGDPENLSLTWEKLTEVYGWEPMIALAKMGLNRALDGKHLSEADKNYLFHLVEAGDDDTFWEEVEAYRERILDCRAKHPDWSVDQIAWEVQHHDGVVDRVLWEADNPEEPEDAPS